MKIVEYGPHTRAMLHAMRDGKPVSHPDLAIKSGQSTWRVCASMNHLEKRGVVVCVQRCERRGYLIIKPGIWKLVAPVPELA